MSRFQSTRNDRPAGLRQLLRLALVTLAVAVTASSLPAAQTVSLAWDPSVSTGVAGYMVNRGTKSGVYTNTFDAGTNLALTLTGLCEGQTNYFQVVAYNSARMLGTPSGELSFTVPGVMRLSAPTKAGNPASLSFPVAPGHTYQVQASTDLASWTTIYTTSTASSNVWLTWQDPQTSGFAKRFYRLILN